MPRKRKNIKFKAEKRRFFVKTEFFDERVKLDNSVYVMQVLRNLLFGKIFLQSLLVQSSVFQPKFQLLPNFPFIYVLSISHG